MRKQIRRNRAVSCAANMPPLRHSTGGQFDIMQSEVAEWLCSQPGVRQYIFDATKEAGMIVYDQDSKTWAGVDWE